MESGANHGLRADIPAPAAVKGAGRKCGDSAHMRGSKGIRPTTYSYQEHPMSNGTRITFPSSPFMRAFAAAVTANVPLTVTGDPGQGKTSTMEKSPRHWGRYVETIIGSTREAADFLGVMVETKEGVGYKPFSWVHRLNKAPKSLLLLDEFNIAAPSTMKAMLRLVEERFVGEEKLHDGVSIVALMNPVETSMDGYELGAALANRMMHMKWVFDAKFWRENVGTDFQFSDMPSLESILSSNPVLNKALVSANITAFLAARPNLLTPPVPKDPATAGGAWPSPRSWTSAMKVLAHLDPRDDEAALLVLQGCVGTGAASEYYKWVEENDLHNVLDVIENPGMVDWKNERPDRLFALVQGVTHVGLADEKLWKKATIVLAVCAEGGKPDVALPGAAKLLSNGPARIKTIDKRVQQAFASILANTKYSMTLAA